ncbi:MAG: hemerythrin domain-containing protein [Polyangiaceae bacterium]
MDICELILKDHATQRTLFALLEEVDRSNKPQLEAIWNHLGAFLETHAEAEERILYPEVLKHGSGAGGKADPPAEVRDAIKDHNQIRDAVAAVAKHAVGSDAWITAVDHANEVNSEHMGEEEIQGLTDMRRNTSLEFRHELGARFAAFDAAHVNGVKPVDKDPSTYIKQNS